LLGDGDGGSFEVDSPDSESGALTPSQPEDGTEIDHRVMVGSECAGYPVKLARRDLRSFDRLHFGKVDSSSRASGDVVLQYCMVEDSSERSVDPTH
jgi:hypothetical protein